MSHRAPADHPLHDLVAERYSPRVFADRDVEHGTLRSLLEAARWAPSCFNAQPWSFLVTTRSDAPGFARLAACLVEGNDWAKAAPLLVLSVARLTFERNGKPNRHALHDVGLAVGTMGVQAQALGLAMHQMAGFDIERARTDLDLPEGFDPVAMIAIGYPVEPALLPEALRERELAPRVRKPQGEFVHGAGWGTPLES